jgi:hypothetical protein
MPSILAAGLLVLQTQSTSVESCLLRLGQDCGYKVKIDASFGSTGDLSNRSGSPSRTTQGSCRRKPQNFLYNDTASFIDLASVEGITRQLFKQILIGFKNRVVSTSK